MLIDLSIDTLSIFREVLSVVMPKEYEKKALLPLKYKNLEEVYKLKKNIISTLDFNDLWVPYYIRTVNGKLNNDYKNISSL